MRISPLRRAIACRVRSTREGVNNRALAGGSPQAGSPRVGIVDSFAEVTACAGTETYLIDDNHLYRDDDISVSPRNGFTGEHRVILNNDPSSRYRDHECRARSSRNDRFGLTTTVAVKRRYLRRCAGQAPHTSRRAGRAGAANRRRRSPSRNCRTGSADNHIALFMDVYRFLCTEEEMPFSPKKQNKKTASGANARAFTGRAA